MSLSPLSFILASRNISHPGGGREGGQEEEGSLAGTFAKLSVSHTEDENRTYEESGTQTSQDSNRGEVLPGSGGEEDEEEIITDGRRIVGQVIY